MKMINQSLEPVLRLAVERGLQNYEHIRDGGFLNDIYLFYDEDNQLITLFDDMERELFTLDLNFEHVVSETGDMQQEVRDTAKYVIGEMELVDAFHQEFIAKPFTVSMVDSDFIILEELIFIDDETMKLDGNLMAGWNKELDEFLKNLMN
ncbi:hypothetical protein AGMMS50262_13600 [Bacteroidia bacterium]|nr:hypothetical protein AGMMS50262_13600 [Bacteroidia bacterium]